MNNHNKVGINNNNLYHFLFLSEANLFFISASGILLILIEYTQFRFHILNVLYILVFPFMVPSFRYLKR